MISKVVAWRSVVVWLTVIQFVAVARAAPLVRMARELISVGYNQGTPSIPEANEIL